MARKSRKETVVLPAPEMDTTCRAGIYVRLSVEDKHTHTASIETQQLIIARYLEQNPEIIVVQTYIDNGATGTNFHRPGFQQMLSDIEAGLINCVIVKDLSRLGRNVIDTGYYIERYFPMQKVRFIAVNDRYDSSSPDNAHDGIIIPLRNMINEAYAMDIARKIKAQQRQAMKDGKYVGGRTPYGYLKAPDDCHQLIVDPVAAEVVKTMFQWAAEGAGLNTIAVRLNEAGYLSPSHYKRTLGEITHENLVGNGHWQTRTVAKILRAEVYTGDLVQGVSKIIDHKQVRASADEWTTVRGTHEAIISRELFAAVQKALDQAAQQAKDREIHSWSPNLLKGKIFCAHCGRSLHRQKCIRRKSQEVYVYHCISNNRIKKGVCPGAFIFEKELLDALADILEDERYIGSYVIGRRAVIEVGGTRSRKKDRDKWFIIPDHHPAIVDKELFEKVQAVQRRFSLPTKKTREYPLKGKVYCGCCDHALSRIAQKRPFYMCRHSTADVNSRCRDVRADVAGLEEAVLLTLKKQLEVLLPVHEDGTIHLEATAAKCSEYEKQLEALKDEKQALFERYLLGQIELDTYKSEKAVYDAEILKVKNAYAAVTAQAKLKREEQARQSSRQEIVHSIVEADVLTSELTDLLIEKVYVFPDNRIEIVYKIHDLFE